MGSSTPPAWTLHPLDYSRESPLQPIHIYMGETPIGRFISPGLKDIGYFSKEHMMFRLTEGADGQIEGTVEYLGSGNQMGLVGNTTDGDKIMTKDGTQHPIKLGDEIHLLKTHGDRGTKGLKYMYTVQEGSGEVAARQVYTLDESDSDLEIDGFGSGKRKRTETEIEPALPKAPELHDLTDLPSDDEEEIDNKRSSVNVGSGKGKERESDMGGGSSQSEKKDEAWGNVAGGFTCQICCDLMVDSTNIDCGHMFCSGCVDDWLGTNGKDSCPTCSRIITTMTPCLAADTLIEEMVDNGKVPEDDAEEYRKRIKLAKDARNGVPRAIRHVAPPAAPAPPAPPPPVHVTQPTRGGRSGRGGRGGRGRGTAAQIGQQANNNNDGQQLALEQSLAEQARQAREIELLKAQLERHKARNGGGGSSSVVHEIDCA